VNVGPGERAGSVLAGIGLAAYGLVGRPRGRWALAAAGAALVYRGLRGHCHLYDALGISRAPHDEVRGTLGMKVDRSMPMDEPAAKLYRFWRDFRNLPIIMSHVESVAVQSDTRSRWTVVGPGGIRLEWDAEIVNDRPDELIAWRTVGGSRVAHAGSVRFEPRPDGGTIVHVSLQYNPPGGELTHMIAGLFGADPGRRIEEDLAELKNVLARAHEDRDGLQPSSADALGYPRQSPR
jgi:uncharacterized membrane protein